MSTTLLTRALRIRVFPQLPGSDFDDVLCEAIGYHLSHPPGEILGSPEAINKMAEKIIEATVHNHNRDHLEAVMMPFLRKDVPYSVAKKIVEHLVLNVTPAC